MNKTVVKFGEGFDMSLSERLHCIIGGFNVHKNTNTTTNTKHAHAVDES